MAGGPGEKKRLLGLPLGEDSCRPGGFGPYDADETAAPKLEYQGDRAAAWPWVHQL